MLVLYFLFHSQKFDIFFLADGCVAACVDVLQITHAAISMVKFFSPDWHRSSAAAFVHYVLCHCFALFF